RAGVVDPARERRLDVLVVGAGCNSEIVELVRKRGSDVARHHIRLHRLIAADPGVVVLGDQPEWRIHPETKRKLPRYRQNEIEIRYRCPAAGIPAFAA